MDKFIEIKNILSKRKTSLVALVSCVIVGWMLSYFEDRQIEGVTDFLSYLMYGGFIIIVVGGFAMAISQKILGKKMAELPSDDLFIVIFVTITLTVFSFLFLDRHF